MSLTTNYVDIYFFFLSKKPQLQINSNSQNNIGNASSPPRTPQSPHGNNLSPDNNLSDCGSTSSVGSNFHRASDLLMAVSVSADVNKMKINELVVAAMEELRNMAIEKEPLWRLQQDGKTEILNDIEYMGQFGHVDATLKEIMRMVEVGEPHFLSSLDSTSESSSFESVYKPNWRKEHELEPILHTEASRETGHVRMNPVSLVGMLMDLVDNFCFLHPIK
jgi:homeobox-leucine zipper protein